MYGENMKKIFALFLISFISFNLFAKNLYIIYSPEKTEEELADYPEYILRNRVAENLKEYGKSCGIDVIACSRSTLYPNFNFDHEKMTLEIADGIMYEFSYAPLVYGEYIKNIYSVYDFESEDFIRLVDTFTMLAESILPYLEKCEEHVLSPSIIDVVDVSNGHENISSSPAGKIAAHDDYSFSVVNYAPVSLVNYDMYGNMTLNLLEKLSIEETKTSGIWKICSSDGNNTVVANSNFNYVYDVKNPCELNVKVSKNTYPLWKPDMFNLSNSGELFSFDYGLKKISVTDRDSGRIFSNSFIQCGNTESIRVNSADDSAIILAGILYVFNPNGILKKCIPVCSTLQHDFNQTLHAYNDDGSFVYEDKEDFSRRKFAYVGADGKKKWQLELSENLADLNFFDYRKNIIYMRDSAGLIYRFFDENGNLPDFFKNLQKHTLRILEDRFKNNDEYVNLAEEYLAHGGKVFAMNSYKKYLELSRADSKISEKKFLVEVELMKRKIKNQTEKVLSLYEEQGKYSAKSEFYKVIPEIEKLMKQVPGDRELISYYQALVDVFDEGASSSFVSDIEVESVEISSLFPALQNFYAKNPAGIMTLKNSSSSELKNLSVSCSLKNFMDYPTESEVVKTLAAGASVDIYLKVVLNNRVFEQSENSDVQMMFSVQYELDGKKKKLNLVRPVTMYKKNAITWDETAMVSCFILPNDSTVTKFSFSALDVGLKDERVLFTKNFNSAMKLVNAIGSIPLNYVHDPVVSTSDLMCSAFSIDTVRFPSDTLKFKGGDCDDMTTLFCSVLESAGIQTMLITIPGHILGAFKLGAKENFFWKNLSDEYATLSLNGELWIPIETTVMSKGFLYAWKTASSELKDKKCIEEMIVVDEQRSLYPPISANIDEEKVIFDKDADVAFLESNRFDIRSFVDAELSRLSSFANKASEMNVIAKTYHGIDYDEKAIEFLSKALELDGNYAPARKNLSAIQNMKKEQTYIAGGKTSSSSGRASEVESDFDWEE